MQTLIFLRLLVCFLLRARSLARRVALPPQKRRYQPFGAPRRARTDSGHHAVDSR